MTVTLIIYSVIVGIAAALWSQIGIWAWPHAKVESVIYLFLAALNIYALVYTASKLFGEFLVLPLDSRFLLVPMLVVPPIVIYRTWKRFHLLMNGGRPVSE